MFSLKIVDTDNFLDMPIGSRLLYYDLSMRADDDGFVDNPKKIMKIIGCAEDDFKVLIAKQYLIPFESGVCVIKHWHVHNLIRSDRYKETDYKLEKSSLVVENNKYLLTGTQNVIPNGNQVQPQVRLGKVRLGKDRIDNNAHALGDDNSLESKFNYLLNSDFKKAFNDYLDMRNKKNRAATKRAKELVLIDLHKYQLNEAISMLEQSIVNSWQGVFPLRNNSTTGNVGVSGMTKAQQYTYDSAMRLKEQLIREGKIDENGDEIEV